MNQKLKKELKSLEVVCKMAQRRSMNGLYFTYGIQSLAHCTKDPNKVDAMLVSANSYPYVTLEKINGEKETCYCTLGN